jgi:phage FluMu protein Com
MAIVFHCQFCNKEIRAADDAGGKWGKCPKCHNKVYVPSVDFDKEDEELKLAPIDTEDLKRKRELMAETYRLTQDILEEREIPGEAAQPAGAMYDMDDEELKKNIILYMRQMAAGELDDAEQTAALISPFSKRVEKILDQISLSQIPEPQLAKISPSVLSGFIKSLRSKLQQQE